MEMVHEPSHEEVEASTKRHGDNDRNDEEHERTTKLPKTADSSGSYPKEPLGSDVLKLNIGGEKTVETLRSTLTFATGSKLAEMFSGRWDKSLPKSKDGNFFIDREPELFLPLLRFLRDLSSMVPDDAKNPLPPSTPSFTNPSDEASFRRMVDSYNLTNVVYNYEVFKTGYFISDYNCRSLVSRNGSILDCPLPDGFEDGREYRMYCLDRPRLKDRTCHGRQVQAFEVALSQLSSCMVGWTRRVQVFTEDLKPFHADLGWIYFSSSARKLAYYDHEGNCKGSNKLVDKLDENAIIRCSKNVETRELEFYIDGKVVARTSRTIAKGSFKAVDNVVNLGWTCPEECELIPYVQTNSGSCRFSALELEN